MLIKGNAAALIVIEVSDEPLDTFAPRQDKNTGMMKPGASKQKCYIHSGNRYPIPFKIRVDDVAGPYKPGFYLLAGDIFKPGDWDGLKFSDRQLGLIPMSEAVAGLQSIGKAEPKLAAAS